MKDGWIQMGSEEDADIGGEVKKEVGICEIYLKIIKKKEKQMSIKVGGENNSRISV